MKENTWKNVYEILENMFWLTFGMWYVDDSYFKWWVVSWISQGVWLFLKSRVIVEAEV